MMMMSMDDCLFADHVPEEPCTEVFKWFEYARENCGTPNWNSVMLATVGADGRPSVRAVLHKQFDPTDGSVIFYTNYNSRKSRDIEANPSIALTWHWDRLHRQIRMEGTAARVEPAVSDAYFATRARESQIGAWASDQSQPLEGWEELLGKVIDYATKFADGPVPRPPHWGGFRLIPRTIELWHGRDGRIHERLLYTRTDDTDAAGRPVWKAQWLSP